MTNTGFFKQTDQHYHIIIKYLSSFYFLKVEYSLDLKFESILHNIIKDNMEEMDMEENQEEEQGEEQIVSVASIASPTIIIVQPGIEEVKEKKKRKKKKRAKFLKFEDDNFSSEVSFKVNVIRDVRTSGGSCQELTLWWSGLR